MIPEYKYKILEIKRVRFWNLDARLDFKSHIATVEHEGHKIKVAINPDDKGTFGYDWDIRLRLYWKFHEKTDKQIAAQKLMAAQNTISSSVGEK
jgi:hypothetical protein